MESIRWPYVRKSAPCKICGRPDWCQVSPDGLVAKCRRVESARPNKMGDAWFHHLNERACQAAAHASAPPLCSSRHDWNLLARSCVTALSPDRLGFLARTLGLSCESLKRLDVGWYAKQRAFTFPMRNPVTLDVLGIRTRFMQAQPGHAAKASIRGGNGGLFIPRELRGGDRLFIVEGPTDAAALMDLGFNAVIGRESCNAGVHLVVALLKAQRFESVVIVSDRDTPKPRIKGRPELGTWCPGQEGAERLARIARYNHPIVRVILPPPGIKDARDWKRAGATAQDIEREVLKAPARKLVIQSTQDVSPMLEGAGLV